MNSLSGSSKLSPLLLPFVLYIVQCDLE